MAAQPDSWRELHLRRARGETLTEPERQQYDAEIQRQDAAESRSPGIEQLKSLRGEVMRLARENKQLRNRVAALDAEIELLERSLSPPTRELLGVAE